MSPIHNKRDAGLITPGTTLKLGQTLNSSDEPYKGYRLELESDGNLVIRDCQSNQLIWESNTSCKEPHLIMQTDGNLVLYEYENGSPQWASNTHNNPGAYGRFLGDGNIAIYRNGLADPISDSNDVLWTSSSSSRKLNPNDSPSRGSGDRVQIILAAHNKYRGEVGVLPLQWSNELAASAQQWANHLAATGKLEHSRAGENLAQGSSGAFSVSQLVDMWGSEKKFFRQGTFPNVSNSGNWADVGHYTQVVWRNTTKVGCGLVSGNGNDVLVCHYNPAGNVSGQSVF